MSDKSTTWSDSDTVKLLAACAEYREKLDKLQRENADIQMSLRNWIDKCAAQAVRLGELERENAALREQVKHLIGMIEQLESDLAHFGTIEAFEGKKEAQP